MAGAAASIRSVRLRGAIAGPRFLRSVLPAVSLAVILGAIFYMNPRTASYFGLNLLLQYAVPIALATIAQMFILAVNDLDLSIGGYVGLVACIGATFLNTDPLLGGFLLLLCIAAYAAMGALIHWRNLPSIVVTLGMLFVWQGIAVIVLPTPGGSAPGWIKAIMDLKTPFVPFPIVASVAIALVVHFALMRSSYGVVLRGSGGNPRAVARAGWSLFKTKVTMFALAGIFGMLSGLSLIGLTTSAQANIALPYTLLSIAGVILGGGEFVGGRVSPAGAVIGALTLALATRALTFFHIPPDWQIGAQGGILIVVLALRAMISRKDSA